MVARLLNRENVGHAVFYCTKMERLFSQNLH